MVRPRPAVAIRIALLAFPVAASLRAQEPAAAGSGPPRFALAGTVVDHADRPLTAAEIRAGGQVAITDRRGRFRITGLADSVTRLEVRRVGYLPEATEIVRAPDVVEIRVNVQLRSAAVMLAPIIVEGERRDRRLHTAGFYERRNAQLGAFLDAEQLRAIGGSYAAVFTSIPSADFNTGKYGAIIPMGRTMTSGGMQRCMMRVYLDGRLVTEIAEVGINGVIPKDELLAMEVYPRASQVPSQYLPTSPGAACGAVLLWSRPYDPSPR